MHPSTKPQPSSDRQSCYRCGKSPGHANAQCPAREVTCHACGKRVSTTRSASVDYRYKVSRHSGFVALSSTFLHSGRAFRHHQAEQTPSCPFFPETVPHTPHTPTPTHHPNQVSLHWGSPERPESPKHSQGAHTCPYTHTRPYH
ncbi:hypothetical protein F7725_001496 [Dissostichus mawsoni]|uniref:CCHC-type domain-containing protein n=1 Tax=Dissostichus mawsoni TaxID=36200 RepID=A0A7J5Y1T5_DISMA|nr:hypothetical protein F7725_001496 [Dissostichus mawsoni]